MSTIPWLGTDKQKFPPPSQALGEPNGLLAAGGDLSSERLLAAYRQGIFPWYEAPDPILWWSPDPRAVLDPRHVHLSGSLRKLLRKQIFTVRADTAFSRVIDGCADLRSADGGTWIGPAMREAYCELHRMGYAHSIETWVEDELAGGLYGVALGRIFFGESMFSRADNASKVAFAHLAEHLRRRNFALIDCQQDTVHMRSFGTFTIARSEFQDILTRNVNLPGDDFSWQLDWSNTRPPWVTR
jgi:leucyl/phenylalanyl-tRNA--protein transferase